MTTQEKLNLIATAQRNNKMQLAGTKHEGKLILLSQVGDEVAAMFPGKDDFFVNENIEIISYKEMKQARADGRYSLHIEDGVATLYV